MPHNDAKLEFHGSHGFGVQSISVRPVVYEVRATELGTAANKHLRQLLLPGTERPPGYTADPVMSGTGGDVAVPVTVHLTSSKWVLVPHLQMEFGPPLEALGCVVQINRVTPVRHVANLGDIHLGLSLFKPRQKTPCSSSMDAPFTEKAALWETASPNNLADNMQLPHIISICSYINVLHGSSLLTPADLWGCLKGLVRRSTATAHVSLVT